MKARTKGFVGLAGLGLMATAVWGLEEIPITVSPGGADGFSVTGTRCPTFSWGGVEGARAYELAVYQVRGQEEANMETGTASSSELMQPVMRQVVPGTALGWTPSVDACFLARGRYAWSVRGLGEGELASEWSEARLFEVGGAPSPAEVESALEVLHQFMQGAGRIPPEHASDVKPYPVRPERTEARRIPAAPEAGEEGSDKESGELGESPLVPSADLTAISGAVSDTTGVTFGLHGTSASPKAGSAGVVGESTADSGTTYGVLGQVQSAAGSAGAFDNTAGGDILRGLADGVEVFSVAGGGTVAATGFAGSGVDLTNVDADLLDGLDSSEFLVAGIDDWVDEVGDTMTGTLTLEPAVGPALVTGSGNVGIGTATPSESLDVAGNVNLSGNLFKSGVLFLHNSGTNNTAVGHNALSPPAGGFGGNTAVGAQALFSNTSGGSNTAVGAKALFSNTSGGGNSSVGENALYSNTMGTFNTAVGGNALRDNTTGHSNTAIGQAALIFNTTGYYNAALGHGALRSNATGRKNTAMGRTALFGNTTGNLNTAVGQDALRSNTGADGNTAIGASALAASTTGYSNTASGIYALASNTTGFRNTASGARALASNTTGFTNTANGFKALYSNTTGSNNTATGTSALRYNTVGNQNTATGFAALRLNTDGSHNTGVGFAALRFNTEGDRNTALGFGALRYSTTGNNNTATGAVALWSNTTGGGNTATGYKALASNTTGSDNSAIGDRALYSNTTGFRNTAAGDSALVLNTTGYNNTASGWGALGSNTTGSRNVAIGYRAGDNLGDGTTADGLDHNIFIANLGESEDARTIRIGTQGTQSDTFIAGIFGSSVTGSTVVVDSNGQLGVTASARRYKEEIGDMGEASSDILSLRPVTFRYKEEAVSGSRPLEFGLIAEEVAELYPDLVAYDEEGRPFTVRYQDLIPMLLNELQKQQWQIQELTARLGRLRDP